MKAMKSIGVIIAIIGVCATISVADGSAHETLYRAIGVAMIGIGSLLAKKG